MSLTFGLALPHYGFSFPDSGPDSGADLARVLQVASQAEALGFDEGWVSDHLFLSLARYGGPSDRRESLEAWATMAAVAASTTRLRVGSLVLCQAFRPPSLLAKMAATLDVASGGRLDLGLGAGWYEEEFAALGIPFERPGVRLAQLEEALGVIAAMFERSPASFEGRFYRVEGAHNEPKPLQVPRPPLWVGGKGDRLLGVVARAADGWNFCWRFTEETFRDRLAVLARACEAAGRDPVGVRLSAGQYTLIGESQADLEARYVRLQAWAPGGSLDGVPLEQFAEGALVGTAEQITERLESLAALGVEHVICSFAPVPFAIHDLDQLEMFASLVIRPLRSGTR
ncbi:MAG: LLM class flavin-dependent oxidoreductase [Actinomycetota bacterium]